MKPRVFKTEGGLAAFLRSRPGAVLHIVVEHDQACTPSHCSCRPWFRVAEATIDGLRQGERQQREWIADCAARLN